MKNLATPESRVERPSPLVWGVAALIAVVLLIALGAIIWRGPAAPAGGAFPSSFDQPVEPAIVTGIFIEPGDGRAPLLAEIEAARHSIDLAVYIITDEIILEALEAAQRRGVAVRVILEEHPFGGAGGQSAIFNRLEDAGIAVRWGSPAFRFTHIKIMVVDDEVAIIMNQNLTASAFTANREFGAITNQPDVVDAAAAIFETDWTAGPEPDPAPLVVSPTNARDELLALVRGAESSLELYAEVLRDPEMLEALAAAAERGVRVRLIMSPSPDFEDERERLITAGVEVRLLTSLYVHAKVIIADGERAYLGSQNLSTTSLDQNREAGIIVDDPVSVARLTRTFELDFRAARAQERR